MSQFRPLIKGQEIGIDDHSRGRASGWGSGLHIHKRFTDKDKTRKGFEILVPFDHNGEVEIRPGRYTRENEYPSIRKEIQKALAKGQKRKEFVKDIADAISRFSRGEATVDSCREAAGRIAGHFGLETEITREIVERYQQQLILFRSYHVDPIDRAVHVITQDKKHVTIKERKNIPKSKTINYHE